MSRIVILENNKFKLEVGIENDLLKVCPKGTIDEDVDFAVIFEFMQLHKLLPRTLEFDLGYVTSMNSCGVREWILFMERAGSEHKCRFVNVGELFVEQTNMISGMLGKQGTAEVVSFQAPYHYSACDLDVIKILDPKKIEFNGSSPVVPEFSCDKCSGPLEFDSIEDEYFGFIRRLKG